MHHNVCLQLLIPSRSCPVLEHAIKPSACRLKDEELGCTLVEINALQFQMKACFIVLPC